MSEDPSTNRRDSDEEDKGVEEIEDGYQTPTSVEHKIPPVTWTPPPAPKKRKRLFTERRVDIRKVEGFDGRIVVEEDLESFFKWIVPRPPPPPPEPDRGTSPKKIRSD